MQLQKWNKKNGIKAVTTGLKNRMIKYEIQCFTCSSHSHGFKAAVKVQVTCTQTDCMRTQSDFCWVKMKRFANPTKQIVMKVSFRDAEE